MASWCCHLSKKNGTMFHIYFHKSKFQTLFNNQQLWKGLFSRILKQKNLNHFSPSFLTQKCWFQDLRFQSICSRVEMSCNLFPALFVYQDVLEFRSCVSGDHDHGYDFHYELDTEYQIEISQSKENEIVTFRILINNSTFKEYNKILSYILYNIQASQCP